MSLGQVGVLVACVVFTLVGVLMIANALSGDARSLGVRPRYTPVSTTVFGVLVILFFGVFGLPVSLWLLRSSWRLLVLDEEGLHMYSWCHLPWPSIVTSGVCGEGEDAQAWAELTPAGAAAHQRLVEDAQEVFRLRRVDGAPPTAVLLPRQLHVTLPELAELVRLATSLRTTA